MALQEVCGFHNIPHSPSWNISLLSSLKNTFCMPGSGDEGLSPSRWRHLRRSSCPLEFYVPVHEYLMENPIQFGQMRPNLNSPTVDSFLSSTSASLPLPFPLGHGTTTLGFVFQGGVIAAADSRSSCSGLVACPASQKILPIHSHLVGTTSGTSADCALWKRILARELRLYQLRHRRRLSVGGAAKLLSHMLHPFKGTELCVAATLCGWDGDGKGTGFGEDDGALVERHANPLSKNDERVTSGETSFQPGSAGAGDAEDVIRETQSLVRKSRTRTADKFSKDGEAGNVVKETCLPSMEKNAKTSPAVEFSRDRDVEGVAKESRLPSSGCDTRTRKTSCQKMPADFSGDGDGDAEDVVRATCLPSVDSDARTRPISSQKMTPQISGPRLVYVCSDGLRLKGKLFSVGSGSPYAYSILDERIGWDLSVEEAVSVAREAVYRATYRDAYSGNNVDLYHVTARGWRRRDREDLKEEYYREKEKERRRVEERRRDESGKMSS